MFETDIDKPKEKQPQRPDYTGLKIGLLVAPVFVLFAYFDQADMGFTVTVVLGMMLLVIKLRWYLRKHVWFWVTIALVLALHIPLFLIVRWPANNVRAAALVFGTADFLATLGALGLAEKLFSKGASPEDEEQVDWTPDL
jgi:hypothetical protein